MGVQWSFIGALYAFDGPYFIKATVEAIFIS